jgi:hypothetical protein
MAELRRHRAALTVGVTGCVLGLALGIATGDSGWPVYRVVAAALTATPRRGA